MWILLGLRDLTSKKLDFIAYDASRTAVEQVAESIIEEGEEDNDFVELFLVPVEASWSVEDARADAEAAAEEEEEGEATDEESAG
jgi:hypothetical protein